MKENKTIKISNSNFDKVISDYKIFKWVIKEDKLLKNKHIVTLERELDENSTSEIKKLETIYFSYKIPNMLDVIILMGVAISLFTLFIIFNFVIKIDTLIALLSFLGPGIIFFTVGSIITFSKTFMIKNIINNEEKVKKEIINSMKTY
jgi:hypothetical protein